MLILITGAAGFVGQVLAEALLSTTDHNLILTDVVDPPVPSNSARAKAVKADLCNSADLDAVVPPDLDVAYVFHGIMSSGAEANYELGMRVNLDATRALFDKFRSTCRPDLRVVYASSQAVYGQPLPAVVSEAVVPAPQSSYGCAKLMCEGLVNDFTRRGFFQGLSLRFPTVTVRPGKPTAAASSFLSGMIREPLQGQKCVIPLEDRSFPSFVCSPKTLVANLLKAIQISPQALPPHRRSVNLPGIRVTIQQMLDALAAVGGQDALLLVSEKSDAAYEAILRSWPQDFDNSLALSLGFESREMFEDAVRDFAATLAR